MVRTAVFMTVIGALAAATPAQAQSGNIYGDAPPRPPADIPNGPFPAQPPPPQYPGQAAPQPSSQPYPAPQQYPPPRPAARTPYGIQAQPLPPPPGATMESPAPNSQTTATPPLPPQGARPMPSVAKPAPPSQQQQQQQQPQPAQPADATPPSDDTVVTVTPTEKIENGRAVFAGLDKITGRTISFDAAIGETVQFGALRVTARACYTRPPTEPTNTDAFVEVDEVTLQGEIKRIFTGWMFASSPGLHAVEHPIYDVWLTNCDKPAGGPVAESTPAPTPAPPAATAPSRQRQPARPAAAPPPSSPAAAPVTDD